MGRCNYLVVTRPSNGINQVTDTSNPALKGRLKSRLAFSQPDHIQAFYRDLGLDITRPRGLMLTC